MRIRWEPVVVATFALVAVLLFGFIRLAAEVGEGDTRGFDRAILLALRMPGDPAEPLGPHWLKGVVVNISSLGSNVVLALVALVVIGFLIVSGRRAAALFVAIATGGGALLSVALKAEFVRPRPELVAHLVQVNTTSFPSGHSLGSAVTYLTLGLLLARFQPQWRVRIYLVGVAMLLTLLIGVSRVYLGVHWPTDVLAGWSIGAAWAIACWGIALRLQRRGVVEPPDGD